MSARTYVAAANRGRSKGPDILRTENDDDPEYREQRREFLKRFFGNREGGVSSREYKRALAEARALPRSPLLEGRMFGSLETSESSGTVELSHRASDSEQLRRKCERSGL